MDDLEAFARSCRDTSRQLRRLPADLRRELGAQVQPKVAVPLAAKVANVWTGPWARALAQQTKARKLADPTVVIGGARRVVRGGANARQLVYGATFGGGKRVSTVTRSTARAPYRARTTRQFFGRSERLFPMLEAESPWVLDQFATIVDDVLGKVRANT